MFIKIRLNNQGERTQGERVVRANGPDKYIVVYCKVESIVKSRVGYFAYSLDDVVASTCPVTVKQ